MSLTDFVRITITVSAGGLTRQGFGTPGILGYTAGWANRVRIYNDMIGVGADFAITTPEYKAANAVFSQNPRPPQLMIFRGALPPTMRWEIKIQTVINSTRYAFKFLGIEYAFTSDASALNDEIIVGLQAAVSTAATAAGFTASIQGVALSTYLRIVGNAPGNWASCENTSITPAHLLNLYCNHADPGVAADLAAVALENNQWYHLITLFNSEAYVAAAASWTESNNRLYTPDVQDTEVITVADSLPAIDIAHDLKAANYGRTGAIYHPDNGVFAGAALPGVCLPNNPGSETWMFKTLAGVPAVILTPTHIANLKAKRCNYYYENAGRAVTAQGQVASATIGFIDIVRFRDWLQVRMQERIYLLLINSPKVPYTDKGIAQIQGEILAQLKEGFLVGGIIEGYTCYVGKAADANPVDKANRLLKNVSFNATLQGAIHELDITGALAA